MNAQDIIAISEIANNAGFTAEYSEEAGLFTFTEPESGLEILSLLSGEPEDTRVLFNSLVIGVVTAEFAPEELLTALTDANNGISTSAYQTSEVDAGLQIALTNYAPIQELGADDADDIAFTLQAIVCDRILAQTTLAEFFTPAEAPKALAAS